MEVISMSWTILTLLISSITTRGSKGTRLLSHEEDRVYLFGNLTGQTPKKRRVTQSLSDLKELNATCSFPTETEQRELDPDCNGADEMMTDEMPRDNENAGDSETIVQNHCVEPEESQSEYP